MKQKMAILCLPGLESFLGEIVDHFSARYEVRACYSNNNQEIGSAVQWADIVWLEWANELTVALTNQPGLLDGKRVVCRLHSYEALAGYAKKINWSKISDVIFVAEHIKDIVLKQVPDLPSNVHVIPNGINLDKFRFKDREGGFNLAFLGDINYKKGPMLLLHAFHSVVTVDDRYCLYIAGDFQDARYLLYFKQMIAKLGLSKNVHFAGKIPHNKVSEWLEDKQYIVCTSVLEGHPVGLMEAMACGLMPVIHNFVGAEGIYPDKYLWNTIQEFVKRVLYAEHDSSEHRAFIQDNYSLETQLTSLDSVMDNLKPMKLSGDVTAVIAVRNGANTIAMALDSLLSQTVPLKKIIIVDDFSSDDTPEIVEKYVANFEGKVELIKLPFNHWVYKARNVGFKEVGTEFFFFLDADDFVEPEYVEKLLVVLKDNPDCAFAYSDMIHFDGRNRKHVPLPDFNVPLLAQRNYIPYSSLMRADAFMSLGGYDNYLNDSRNPMAEWDLWLRFAANGKNGVHCPEPLFCYRQHKDQMTRSYERSWKDMRVQMVFNAEADVPRVCGSHKRGLLVCKGRDYLDYTKVGGEVYTWLKPLEEFGEVATFFYDVEALYFGQEGMIKRLHALIDQIQPEYIFHSAYKEEIPVETWTEISKKFTTIAWFSDDNWRFESYSRRYCKGFQYAVTTYPMIYEDYKEIGYENILLSQWAANPAYFKDYDLPKDIDVSFCGQSYGDRFELMQGLDIQCFGKGWLNGMLEFKDMARVLNRSKISINFSKGASGEPQIKMRPFEIAASNTMPLCEYVEGIERYYKIGKEIVVFRNERELKDKIDYYLKNHTEREEIASAAFDRTMKDHTWHNRFESIFKTIGVLSGL